MPDSSPIDVTVPRRLRVLDVMTRWVWIVLFWRRQFGEPWLELSVFPGIHSQRSRLLIWKWEPEPDKRPAMAITQTGAHFYEGTRRGE